MEIKPQSGFQEKFLSSSADIVIGGGAAGAGKTYALVLESLRNTNIKDFGAVFFRRTYNQIAAIGGLWDETNKIYPLLGAKSNNTSMSWKFPSGAKVDFSHMQHEKNLHDWQGSQIPLILFDELQHFSRKMFMYMLSRNRSTCGVSPYVRATCNPDADSFIAELIEWWIDKDGFIIPERDGIIRYFTQYEDEIIWGSTKEEVIEKSPHLFSHDPGSKNMVKSFTFIEGDIYDNKILLEKNPEYIANLQALPEEDKLRLLKKNWKISISKNTIIDYVKFIDIFNNSWVKQGVKYITCDIATKGSDLLVIGVWDGKILIDLILFDKNSGKEAIQAIESTATKHSIMNSNIIFDADGIGGGLTGFIDNCIEFHNGGKVINEENYENVKTQLYYKLSYCINQDGSDGKTEADAYYISEHVANMRYPFDKPAIYRGKKIKDVFLHQIKAIKRDKEDLDGKLRLIKKDAMKAILGGISPDLLDMLMMRERFELIRPKKMRVFV